MRQVLFSALVFVGFARAVLIGPGAACAQEAAAPTGVALIDAQTPWRVWLVTGRRTGRDKTGSLAAIVDWNKTAPLSAANLALTRLPPDDWRGLHFDDHLWGRYSDDLSDWCGLFGNVLEPASHEEPKTLCMRTRFGIADPARASDVRLEVEYVGGLVAYLNGKEIGRGNMRAGELPVFVPADDYPRDAYTLDDPKWPAPAGPSGANDPDLKHLRKRVRSLSLNLPADLLVKGANVLALEIHHAVLNPEAPLVERRRSWWHVGVGDVKLTSASGAGVIAYADAAKPTRLWSAQPIEQVTARPKKRQRLDRGAETIVARSAMTQGLVDGNPFDPVVPVRIQVPRNGIANGQVVLSAAAGLEDVSASMGDLAGPASAKIPATAVTIRYASQGDDVHWCDELLVAPPADAAVMPIWLEVRAAKDQKPGWYAADLEVKANGKQFQVPVQVLVSGLVVPDAKDLRSLVYVCHSPDALAIQYKLAPWSDGHFRMMERSLAVMGQLGNDVMLVPVVLGSHLGVQHPLVRFVARGDDLVADFSLLERYIDLYLKYCAPPKAVVFYLWTGAGESEVADVYENRRIPVRTMQPRGRLQVSVCDPQTHSYTARNIPVATDDGAERFYQPLLTGIRAVVTKRGWPETVINLGIGSDHRPSQRAGEIFRKWAPYARWDVYSHFSGDPGPSKEGHLVATGGLEVGVKESPTTPSECCHLRELMWPSQIDYLCLPVLRGGPGTFGSPVALRTAIFQNGRWTRLHVDFWPRVVRNGNLIWGATPLWLLGRREGEPVPTVRLQLIREGLQDFEAMLSLQLAQTTPADPVLAAIFQPGYHRLRPHLENRTAPGDSSSYTDLMMEMYAHVRAGCGIYGCWSNLPQTELGYDWPSWLARLHAAAAKAAGTKTDASWTEPPK